MILATYNVENLFPHVASLNEPTWAAGRGAKHVRPNRR